MLLAMLLSSGQGAEIPVHPGESIQEAVDLASPGDTIKVFSGTYYENLDLNRAVVLQGVDGGHGRPVIDARRQGNAITISADEVTVQGLWAMNSNEAGIAVLSSRNTLLDNEASGNSLGMYLANSTHNLLRDNDLHDNEANFEVIFLTMLPDYGNDIDVSNLVDGKPIYYIVDGADVCLGPSSNAGLVVCINCQNVTVNDLHLARNAFGILLFGTSGSLIDGNHIRSNKGGIYLQNSANNSIKNNTIIENKRYGIFMGMSVDNCIQDNLLAGSEYGIFMQGSLHNLILCNRLQRDGSGLQLIYNSQFNEVAGNNFTGNRIGISLKDSSRNLIYLNDFTANDGHAYSGSSSNRWNSTRLLDYVYAGQPFHGYLGNFWGQVAEEDDGVVDQPYAIGEDADAHPLSRGLWDYGLEMADGCLGNDNSGNIEFSGDSHAL